jgi:pimeloyl-ACP methyl ester carboxylesterase
MQKNEVAAYARVLAKARASGDSNGVASLERSGPPPYHASRQIGLQRQWATKYEPGEGPMGLIVEIITSPDYSLKDFGNYFRGVIDGDRFLGKTLDGPCMRVDLPTLGTDFSVPFFIVEGADDDITPAGLAKTYFDQITAPRKAFLLMPDAGHAALLTRSTLFLKFLLNDVRPVVSAARH